MAESFESVRRRAEEAAGRGAHDRSPSLRATLTRASVKPLELFHKSTRITSRDIAGLFSISERAARNLLAAWVGSGFLVVADPAKKHRSIGLASEFRAIV